MAVKVTKGQICDGTISKNKCHQEYYLHGNFHAFMKKCTILPTLRAVPLYYVEDFEAKRKLFLHEVQVVVEMEGIPVELIINFDQTGIKCDPISKGLPLWEKGISGKLLLSLDAP